MFLADKGVTGIPKRWQHNPDLLSSHKLTVAGYYARNDIIPPGERCRNSVKILKQRPKNYPAIIFIG